MKGVILIILGVLLCSCATSRLHEDKVEVLDLRTAYEKVDSEGVFILKSPKEHLEYVYNSSCADSMFSPASTFKIVHSIIALETGSVNGIYDTLKWDGVIRDVKEWNRDTDMKSAFSNSTVWYYQQIARKIGIQTMRKWLDSLDYGRGEVTTIDRFWLNGELKISPRSQLEFMERLANRKLPIKLETYAALESIMQREVKGTHTLYGKTGWGFEKNMDIGWFVGYVKSPKDTYPFVNVLLSKNGENPDFGSARIYIVTNILNNLGITTQ